MTGNPSFEGLDFQETLITFTIFQFNTEPYPEAKTQGERKATSLKHLRRFSATRKTTH